MVKVTALAPEAAVATPLVAATASAKEQVAATLPVESQA
jgi:hypothetical protein